MWYLMIFYLRLSYIFPLCSATVAMVKIHWKFDRLELSINKSRSIMIQHLTIVPFPTDS